MLTELSATIRHVLCRMSMSYLPFRMQLPTSPFSPHWTRMPVKGVTWHSIQQCCALVISVDPGSVHALLWMQEDRGDESAGERWLFQGKPLLCGAAGQGQ